MISANFRHFVLRNKKSLIYYMSSNKFVTPKRGFVLLMQVNSWTQYLRYLSVQLTRHCPYFGS